MRSIRKYVRRVIEQGVTTSLDDATKKRVRLTNGVSLFGAFVMLASVPFDLVQAPRWMVVEDVIGGLAYLGFPLLNRHGHLTASRMACLILSNLIVLGNAVLLGHDSGAEMIFVALVSLPFTMFDVIRERRPLAFGILLSVACFAVAHSEVLAQYQHISENYSPQGFHVYSGVVALIVVLFTLIQTSLANARAERALREDINERLRAERELAETRQSAIYAAKMATLGEMSSNIAHEINNPLAAMLLRAQQLRRLLGKEVVDPAAVARGALEIERIVHRIKRIVDSLRLFARDAEKDPMRPESVLQIVGDSVELCAQRFRNHDIELAVDPIAEDLYVECRSVQISQVLLNLLGNAHDAVETQTTRRVRIAVESTDGAKGQEVRIAVIDSGPGIPPELAGRIMEPFFTTKELGKGTGLGLSVSKGIAEAHGGELWHDRFASQTRFVLTLKRVAPPDKALDQEGAEAVP
jgi:C4-dicarboxylate-specific signal transduction histidine kinase